MCVIETDAYIIYYIYTQNTKLQSAVKLTVVPCAPVVEVKIKRPDTKYQLGFSVQNGVVSTACRLMKVVKLTTNAFLMLESSL